MKRFRILSWRLFSFVFVFFVNSIATEAKAADPRWALAKDGLFFKERILALKSLFEQVKKNDAHGLYKTDISRNFTPLVQSYTEYVRFNSENEGNEDETIRSQRVMKFQEMVNLLKQCENFAYNLPVEYIIGDIGRLNGELGLQKGSFRKDAEEHSILQELESHKATFHNMKDELKRIQIGFRKWNIDSQRVFELIQTIIDYKNAKEWEVLCSRVWGNRSSASNLLKKKELIIYSKMSACLAVIQDAEDAAELEWERTHPEEAAQKRMKQLAERAAAAEAAAANARAAAVNAQAEMEHRLQEQERRIEQAEAEAADAKRAARAAKREARDAMNEAERRRYSPPGPYGW